MIISFFPQQQKRKKHIKKKTIRKMRIDVENNQLNEY